MKRILLIFIILFSLSHYINAQVLTAKESGTYAPGTWLCFRTTFNLDQAPSHSELRIAADSTYWLWVNGNLQVREGGLKRGPNPQDTYCDILKDTKG